MNIMKIMFPLYETPDDGSAGGEELSVDDIVKELADEDDKEEKDEELEVEIDKDDEEDEEEEPKKESKKEKEDKDDDEDDDDKKKKEIELVDEDEDEEEEQELVVPVSWKKIAAKYPGIEKDFPYLKRAYFDDMQYKEIIPTIEDAKELVDKGKMLDGFEQKLLSGSTEDVLVGIKNADQNAFAKIVDNYLPTLAKVDQRAFDHVLGTVIQHTIVSMINEAKANKDEELGKAAVQLQKHVFKTEEFKPLGKLSKEENTDETKKIEQERLQFTKDRFEVTRNDLDTKIHNVLKSTINSHIDPKGSMTDYVRRNAVREALELTDKIIANDKLFRNVLDGLWKKAFQSNFTSSSIQTIRSAYLSKAKTVLPGVIQKIRNEALKGSKSNNSNKERRGLIPAGRPSANSGTKIKSAKDIPANMSTIDFLNSD